MSARSVEFNGVTMTGLDALLFQHYLAEMQCEHDDSLPTGGRDRAICACSMVDLGWKPTVGDAVISWIGHLREVSGESVAS